MILKEKITLSELKEIAGHIFGDMVKAVADVDKQILAIDAELHSDLESELLANGSNQESLWGFNLYPEESEDFIEYDSLINIRPRQNNRSRDVEDPVIREKIVEIVKEQGYVGFDKEGAEMLFNHLSLRTGKRATIITTNLPFTRWEEVLKDKVLCSALVDRLCHKSYLVNMTGTSYRIKETKKLIENK